jgi:formate-dependent phosphoribosylglycinamide formyltransferase (GAR transformylase)
VARLLLLLTTASYRASAFLEAASRLGMPVTVGSERPQVLSAANPAGNLTLDFSDPEGAARAIVAFAGTYPIAAVLAADDDGVVLAATAAAALGLPHSPVDAVAAARDKHRMRERLSAAGVPCPRFTKLSIDEDSAAAASTVAVEVGYPCVLKPLSLAASRGVIRADDPAGLAAAFRRLGAILHRPELSAREGALARHILVESFIPGVEVALEGLLSEGELRVLALFDKPDPLEGPFFEETIYVTPSRLPARVRKSIADHAQRVVTALGLTEGPVHVELRVNEEVPWILEVAPRSIGGLCSRTLRFNAAGAESAFFSLEEVILRQAFGIDGMPPPREGAAAGVMMIPIPRAGILREVRGRQEARKVSGIEDVLITIPVGQEVVPLPEGTRYLGFIFARSAAPENVEAALRKAHGRLTFDIEPAEEALGKREVSRESESVGKPSQGSSRRRGQPRRNRRR